MSISPVFFPLKRLTDSHKNNESLLTQDLCSFFLSSYCRKSWVDGIEAVKRKLEDGDTVEADEANDPSNPFSKRGEKKSRKGKSKVVSKNII